jgi:hypothetical protein
MKNFIYFNSVAAHPHHQRGTARKANGMTTFQRIIYSVYTKNIHKKKK